MKFNLSILLLLGATSAHKLNRHRHHHHRFNGVPIGEKLLQVNINANKWDSDVLKVMNADSYLDDVRDSMNETVLNIESHERPEGGKVDELTKVRKGPQFAQKD